MRRFALLLPVGLLLAGCSGPARKPPESREPAVIRVARPAADALAERLQGAVADRAGIVWAPPGDADVDVAVVYGISEQPGMVARRIPAWDRSWFLELEPLARWVNDPTFRRWLAARIDRPGMAQVLFGDGAEPIPSSLPQAGKRPVSSGAQPRLQIVREVGNRTAERIVSRLRADLLPDRVVVETADLSPDRAIALRLLDQDPAYTGSETDTVIPLIREHAYLWVRDGLEGIVTGPDGEPDFRNARWAP
jgi:hypothetical protein